MTIAPAERRVRRAGARRERHELHLTATTDSRDKNYSWPAAGLFRFTMNFEAALTVLPPQPSAELDTARPEHDSNIPRHCRQSEALWEAKLLPML
jgi:hypothetical protein